MEAFEAVISLLVIGLAVFAKTNKNKKKKAKAIETTGGWDWMVQPQAAGKQSVPVSAKTAPAVMQPVERSTVAGFPSGFASRPETVPVDEGVDPCHDEMYGSRDEEQPVVAEGCAVRSEAARELVRGFVMAEVLAKPKFREAGRK